MAASWRSLINHRDPRFMVKGHELAVSFRSGYRFAVYEVRTLEADGHCGTAYRIRDAHTVSDAEVRARVAPKVVADGLTWDEVEAFCGEDHEH